MNPSSFNQFLSLAFERPWTATYTKIIAVILGYGAIVHTSNIFGLSGTAWLATPLLWRVMDVLLLIFNIITAVALWRGLTWSIWLLFGGMIVLQILPYTVWRSQFVLKPGDGEVLNGLLGTEILLLSILCLLLWFKK